MLWLLLVACGMFESPEEQLMKARTQQRGELTALYAEYGGSEFAKAMDGAMDEVKNAAGEVPPAGEDVANAFLQAIKGVTGEADRSVFEATCVGIGQGERGGFLSDKSKTFFERSDVQRRCLEVAKRELRIHELERQVGVAE